jgi:hypothetical protein
LIYATTILQNTDSAAEGDSLFSIQENSVVRAELIERFLESHFVKRFAIVAINTNRLRDEIRSASRLSDAKAGRSLSFDVFEDLSFDLQPTLVQDETSGVAFWSGQLESKSSAFASVGLHINWNDEVTGNFRTSIGRIRVEPTEELPYHIVWLQDFQAEQDGSRNGGSSALTIR